MIKLLVGLSNLAKALNQPFTRPYINIVGESQAVKFNIPFINRGCQNICIAMSSQIFVSIVGKSTYRLTVI
jgi:hypothetical protein